VADLPAPERWARVQDLFLAALERDGDERAAFLADACGTDEDLRTEVESLLGAHEGAGLLDDLSEAPPSQPDPGGGQIGAYRILHLLGEGGMGAVYLAEREGSDFTQHVAIKLLRGSFFDRRLERRLKNERRLLARLEHPGIARLIDGGATAAGQPYCVMEFVEGTSLLEHADRARLSPRERLSLFLDICEPVSYAHQRLVVHRDIKPSNILVTSDGHPKLLDFGIAKALDPTEEGTGMEIDLETRTGTWFTPAYASPEQMRGDEVGTQSDVYALGVVLYELLTGRRPYEVETSSPAEAERIVCERVPDRPSAVVTRPLDEGDDVQRPGPDELARARRSTPRRLRKLLQGDVDTIVMKALAKEPERRYASVAQLADDVRRYLDGMPVLARPDSVRYRASKFLRRHRLAVTATTIVFLALIAGLGATAWQTAVARRERDRAHAASAQAEDVTAFLIGLFEASDPTEAPADTAAARAVLQRGLDRVEELAQQPLVQAEMLDALGMVLVNMGQYARGRDVLERALHLRQRAYPAGHADVATSMSHLGRALRMLGEYQAAESIYLDALAMRRRVQGPDDPAVADALLDLGFLMPYFGRLDDALAYDRDALALQRRVLGRDDPGTARSLLRVGASLRRKGDYAGADAHYREALAIQRRAFGAEHPVTARTMSHLGDLIRDREPSSPQAEGLYREAIAIVQRTRGDDHLDVVHPMGSLVELLLARGSQAEAESLQREVVGIRLKRLGPDHPGVAMDIAGLANVLIQEGRYDDALTLLTDATIKWRPLLGEAHPVVVELLKSTAHAHIARGEYAAADSLVLEAVTLLRTAHGDQHLDLAMMQATHADILRMQGQYAAADSLLKDVLERVRRAQSDEHPNLQTLYRSFVALYEAWGKPEEADRYRALLK